MPERRPKIPRSQTRVQRTGSGFKLTVPSRLARLVGPERVFQVELTDEGILFRFVDGGGAAPVELPPWLTS